MPTPTPLPVIVTNNGTDWWAQLLDGLLGAVVAAVVSALVAIYVVRRQHRHDRQTARELAALAAAEAMTEAAIDVYDQMPPGYAAPGLDLQAAHHWASRFQLKQAALFGYVEDTDLMAFQAELIRHAELTSELAARAQQMPLDERTGTYPGRAQLDAEHLASMQKIERQMQTVLQTLGTFRGHGKP